MKRRFDWEHIALHNSRSRSRRRPLGGVARRKRWFVDLRGAFEQLEDRRLLAVDPAANAAVAPAARVQSEYGRLPLSFEANQGQTASQVDYLARGAGYTLYLTGSGAVINLRQAMPSPASGSDPAAASQTNEVSGTVIDMQFVGANPGATVTGLDQQQAKSNYFVGSDPNQWHAGIANFGQVEYQNLYSGIDAVFHGSQGQLEYDFNIAPGADPNQIQWQIAGATGLSLDNSGNLLIHTAGGDLIEKSPNIYQEIGGQRVAVSGHFTLEGGDRVGFAVGGYDASLPLVIDPTLNYATYLGGSLNDSGFGIAADGAGNAYVTGQTISTNFPTTPGAYSTTLGAVGTYDAFVTKLAADGKSLVYSTYLGGAANDGGYGIAVDADGNAYVGGYTYSANFPTTAGAFQMAPGGGEDAFVAKLNASGGSLSYSTFLGGTADDYVKEIALGAAGNAYVTGVTHSSNLPTTPGAFRTTFGGFIDAFATKLSVDGSSLDYSTYLGGSQDDYGQGITVDSSGNAYISGDTHSTNFPTTPGAFHTTVSGQMDAFVTKLNAAGSGLVYSTYLGAGGNDYGIGIAVDASGYAYVTGHTSSGNFPTTTGAFQTALAGITDAYATKLNLDGSGLVYSTYLGGSGDENSGNIAVDGLGNAWLTGYTDSANFPTTANAYQAAPGGGSDAYVSKLNAQGSGLVYSTYLGGTGNETGQGIAVDSSGNAYAVGDTNSNNFPTTAGAFQTAPGGGLDGFVAKFQLAPPTTPVDSDPAPNTVVEGAATGTYVGLTASSTDPEGGSITYSLTSDSSGGGFQIDPVTGRVTVADSSKIIYATAPGHAYQVTVQALSTGGLTSSQTFSIAVRAVPTTPVDSDPAPNMVVEGDAAGTYVGLTAFSTDPEGGSISYSLTSDSSGGGFQIDPVTGRVTVADSGKISYATAPGHAYQVTVQALSTGGLTSSQTFSIAVRARPTTPVDSDPAPNTVVEGAATGTYVGLTASSTDPEGGSITYSLTSDSSGGGFQIDPATGRVTVADSSKIIYATAPGHAYQVTVQALSTGGLASSQTFSIAVRALPTTPVDSDPAPDVVVEGDAAGTYVGLTAFSTDPEGGSITYSLTSDSSSGGFQIDPVTGRVTVADSGKISYATAPGHAYQVAVQALSTGGLTSSQVFSIAVHVRPTTPIDSDPAPNTVLEGAAVGTYVGLTASSTDPEGGSVAYSLTSDSSGGGFQIDPVTGRVTVADGGKISYLATPNRSYQVTVQATSTGGLTSSQTFTIAVTTETTQNQRFISELYIDLLNRSVDPGALVYWVGRLSAGQTRDQVAFDIEQSLEYRQHVVAGLYSRYLHRAADPGGLGFFTQLLGQGFTVEQVSAMLAGSTEYFVLQGGTNDGFLNALYQDALGRPIDPGGLAWWNAQLAAGLSRTQVADLILASDEYRQDLVQTVFQQLLRRAPTPGGLTYWVSVLQAGATDQQLNAAIAGSDEYYARTA